MKLPSGQLTPQLTKRYIIKLPSSRMLHNSFKMPPSCFSPYLSFAPKWCKNAAAIKVVFVVCEQQSRQSDQRLCYSLSRKKIDKLATSKLSIF